MLAYPIHLKVNEQFYFSTLPPAKQKEMLKHLSKRLHSLSHTVKGPGQPVELTISAKGNSIKHASGPWVTTLKMYEATEAHAMTSGKLQDDILNVLRSDQTEAPACPLSYTHLDVGRDQWRAVWYCETSNTFGTGVLCYIMADKYDMSLLRAQKNNIADVIQSHYTDGPEHGPIDLSQWSKGIVYPDRHINGDVTGPGSGLRNNYDAALLKRMLNGLAKLEGCTVKKLQYTVKEFDNAMRVTTAGGNSALLGSHRGYMGRES